MFKKKQKKAVALSVERIDVLIILKYIKKYWKLVFSDFYIFRSSQKSSQMFVYPFEVTKKYINHVWKDWEKFWKHMDCAKGFVHSSKKI